MFANFYYRKSTGTYGTGPWLWDDIDPITMTDKDPFCLDPNYLRIGEVQDQELFGGKEFVVSGANSR